MDLFAVCALFGGQERRGHEGSKWGGSEGDVPGGHSSATLGYA